MDENKRIDNPRIKSVKCVGAKAQHEKNVFQHTKYSVIDLVLTDRRNLSGTTPKSACGNLPVVDLWFLPREFQ